MDSIFPPFICRSFLEKIRKMAANIRFFKVFFSERSREDFYSFTTAMGCISMREIGLARPVNFRTVTKGEVTLSPKVSRKTLNPMAGWIHRRCGY